MLAQHDLDEENEIITDKSLEGTKKKKRANKPNEFVTNDDFCPSCGLRLKNMPEEQNNFWTEIFQREINDNEDPNAMMAAGGRRANPAFCCSAAGAWKAASGPNAGAHGSREGRYRRGAEEARAGLSLHARRRRTPKSRSTSSWRFAATR